MAKEFWWREVDVKQLLPEGWQEQLLSLARTRARSHVITPTSITSREDHSTLELPVLTVGGAMLREETGWLCDLYLGEFRRLGQSFVKEQVVTASQWRYAINLNLQQGNKMRYECHVDSNPLEGLLYVTDHPAGSGGELVVARQCDARGVGSIRADSWIIRPKAGFLVFFDARKHPHFVEPLTDPHGVRLVVAMNYYTLSCPESARPADLDKHLGLT